MQILRNQWQEHRT